MPAFNDSEGTVEGPKIAGCKSDNQVACQSG
jgi:hypothetical protein